MLLGDDVMKRRVLGMRLSGKMYHGMDFDMINPTIVGELSILSEYKVGDIIYFIDNDGCVAYTYEVTMSDLMFNINKLAYMDMTTMETHSPKAVMSIGFARCEE